MAIAFAAEIVACSRRRRAAPTQIGFPSGELRTGPGLQPQYMREVQSISLLTFPTGETGVNDVC
jgi:hypothetical protein